MKLVLGNLDIEIDDSGSDPAEPWVRITDGRGTWVLNDVPLAARAIAALVRHINDLSAAHLDSLAEGVAQRLVKFIDLNDETLAAKISSLEVELGARAVDIVVLQAQLKRAKALAAAQSQSLEKVRDVAMQSLLEE